MGADFNHLLMMSDYNPIKGYININPNLNDKLNSELENFIRNYNNRQIFYYLSSAKYGDPQEKESFSYLTDLNQQVKNPKINFSSEEFKSGKESLFSASIKDGLLHVFNLFRNLNEYTDFKDYAKNYLNDMILTYRINARLEQADVIYYASKIIEEKNVEAYEEMISTLDKLSSANPDQKVNFTTIDKAGHYFKMGWTEKSLEYWNLALSSYSNKNSRLVDPRDFYNNFTLALEAYQSSGNTATAISFLEKSIKVLPQYR
jgi:tetratricopeptide (TPR) repeat protein